MDNLLITSLIAILGSFLLVFYLIPKIRYIVTQRQLIDLPDKRSSHKLSTPTMAGISFFLTLIIALNLINNWDIESVAMNLIAALTIIFALGLKDDLVISTPRAKIGGEILAILFILFHSSMQVESFEGFLGIYELPKIVSYVFVVLMILTIVNSYNLIDGIDGLASIIGIVIFGVFGFLFFIIEMPFYFLFCLILIGMQLAYLRYNLSKLKKIFMGDTGSLTIGFCIGFLSLKFLSLDQAVFSEFSFQPENKIVMVASLLFIPLFDTLRVLGIRLLNKQGPFSPDNNHIHHILINSGLSHFKASLFLGLLSLGFSVLFITLSLYLESIQMLGVLAISFLLLLGLFDRLKNNVRSENKFKYLVRAIHFLF